MAENNRRITSQHMPRESIGLCKNCKTQNLLGDGLCVICWDSKFRGLFVSKIVYTLDSRDRQKQIAKDLGISIKSVSRYKALVRIHIKHPL